MVTPLGLKAERLNSAFACSFGNETVGWVPTFQVIDEPLCVSSALRQSAVFERLTYILLNFGCYQIIYLWIGFISQSIVRRAETKGAESSSVKVKAAQYELEQQLVEAKTKITEDFGNGRELWSFFFSAELQHRLGVDQVDAMISKRQNFFCGLKSKAWKTSRNSFA